MFERRYEIMSDCLASAIGVEVYSIEKQKSRLIVANESVVDQTRAALEVATGWLPAAAEEMNISPNLKDYVLAPVVIMTNDLPNRNQVAFPYEELTKFNVELGDLAYRSWRGKPTFKDHVNKDHTKALGVVFDVGMRKMKNAKGNVWKVIALCGYDRSRQPVLANSIVSKPSSFSMGAFCATYKCSICNNEFEPNRECEHVKLGRPDFRIYDNQLAYYDACGINGFEVSHVESGAFYSAQTESNMVMVL